MSTCPVWMVVVGVDYNNEPEIQVVGPFPDRISAETLLAEAYAHNYGYVAMPPDGGYSNKAQIIGPECWSMAPEEWVAYWRDIFGIDEDD